jgi:hypothetical protein
MILSIFIYIHIDMEVNSNISNDIDDIKNKVLNLTNMIDNKCLDIYNKNEENENKILRYKTYIENIILEHHKICKIMFGKKNI